MEELITALLIIIMGTGMMTLFNYFFVNILERSILNASKLNNSPAQAIGLTKNK